MSRTNTTSNFFLPLYSISFMWYAFNGVVLTVLLALLCSLFSSKFNRIRESTIDRTWENSKSEIDPSLLISWEDITDGCLCRASSKPKEGLYDVQVDQDLLSWLFDLIPSSPGNHQGRGIQRGNRTDVNVAIQCVDTLLNLTSVVFHYVFSALLWNWKSMLIKKKPSIDVGRDSMPFPLDRTLPFSCQSDQPFSYITTWTCRR